MATAIIFDLISALVTTCTSAVPVGTVVYDGQASDDTSKNFLMIGVADPDSDGPSASASGTLQWAGLGHRSSKEYGTVTCCAAAWTGDIGNAAQKAVREAVRDISSSVESALRNDPTLGGVPGLNWVRYGGAAGEASGNWSLDQLSAEDGVAAIFQFEIAYLASL